MRSSEFSVGLTGGIGSGKTTIANMFAARGAAVVDTDEIARQLTASGGIALPAIRKQFGAEFIGSDGAMDRIRMRQHVFTDTLARERLEGILHPLIAQVTADAAARAQGDYLIFVVPLLVESGSWKNRVSRVLVVDCPEELQIQRVMRRNAMSESEVRAIMAAQVSREARLAAANDVLTNDGEPNALAAQIDDLHALYKSLAQSSQAKNPPQDL